LCKAKNVDPSVYGRPKCTFTSFYAHDGPYNLLNLLMYDYTPQSLPSSVTCITLQVRARHERRCITNQENCHPSILLRLTQLLEHVLLWPILSPQGCLTNGSSTILAHTVIRRYGFHTDSILALLHGKVFSPLRCGRFWNCVSDQSGPVSFSHNLHYFRSTKSILFGHMDADAGNHYYSSALSKLDHLPRHSLQTLPAIKS
jgi:hypothetical protein